MKASEDQTPTWRQRLVSVAKPVSYVAIGFGLCAYIVRTDVDAARTIVGSSQAARTLRSYRT